uniref:Uncharacterized protein n=1 Tax=Anguilla anguilla TaxID=7936 RepID=A0A0E9XZX7_ANGAN
MSTTICLASLLSPQINTCRFASSPPDCSAHAETVLNALTTEAAGTSLLRCSAFDSGYWFRLRLLLTSTRTFPASISPPACWRKS